MDKEARLPTGLFTDPVTNETVLVVDESEF
jgi:hypothetical protein